MAGRPRPGRPARHRMRRACAPPGSPGPAARPSRAHGSSRRSSPRPSPACYARACRRRRRRCCIAPAPPSDDLHRSRRSSSSSLPIHPASRFAGRRPESTTLPPGRSPWPSRRAPRTVALHQAAQSSDRPCLLGQRTRRSDDLAEAMRERRLPRSNTRHRLVPDHDLTGFGEPSIHQAPRARPMCPGGEPLPAGSPRPGGTP